jgi:hypothetical protein
MQTYTISAGFPPAFHSYPAKLRILARFLRKLNEIVGIAIFSEQVLEYPAQNLPKSQSGKIKDAISKIRCRAKLARGLT